MSDIVERLRDTGVSTGWEAVIRDAHEAADEIERLNSELTDALTDLDSARQDNASLTPYVQELRATIERLRAALDTVRASGLLIGSTTLHDRVRSAVYNAIDAPAEEKKR